MKPSRSVAGDLGQILAALGPRVLEAWQARAPHARQLTPARASRMWGAVCALADRYEVARRGGVDCAFEESVPARLARRLQRAAPSLWPAIREAVDGTISSPDASADLAWRTSEFLAALAPVLHRARWQGTRARIHDRFERRRRETDEAIRVFRALFDFSREVACALDLDSARTSIIRGATHVLHADWVCLYEPDLEGRTLRMVASSRGAEFAARAPRVDLAAGALAAQAYQSLTCKVLRAVEGGAAPVAPEHAGPVSALFVPLLGVDGPKGVLVLGTNSQPRELSQLEIDTALAFAGHAALAVENAGLFSEARATNERWAALLDVCRVVSSSLDRDTILRRIVEHAASLSVARGCTLFLLDPEREELYPIAANESVYVEEIMAMRLKLGEGITGDVARTGKPEIVPHAIRDPRARHVDNTPEDEDECLCCVPLVSKDRVLGVMTLAREVDRPFHREDLELLIILAHHGSVAIDNARLYGDARRALRELEEAQQHLVRSERLNAFGQVAGGVAHDFNNLLAAILGRTQLMLLRTEDPAVRAGLKVIEQTAHDGVQTVRRIQEFTRVRRDQDFIPVDLHEVVRSGLEMLAQALHTRPAEAVMTLETDLGPVPTVDGSPSELREVLTNLVLNAADAMPAGGRLTVRTLTVDGNAVLQVQDTGTGMSPEVQARAFDPFYTTKKSGGTGLGLSIALGIANRHKGTLKVESQAGQGTCFTLTLPQGTRVPEVETTKQDAELLEQVKVLVVDDEPTVREVMRDMLVNLGHQVILASDGSEALSLLRAQGADVVMTDLGMPGLNGWQVAQAVKCEWPGVPVVLITGWGGQLDLQEARNQNVDFVVSKPFQMEDVLRVLGQAVRLARRDAA
ncbi:MAG: GAF domain-containing protein [Candidatus Eisenbacteria bacterium]|nr:GAF domain-containing protein [Candidatus Eisenbacteria bacterium]